MTAARILGTLVVSVLGVAGASGVAHALHTGDHKTVTYNSCVEAGFPTAFCKEAGVQAYNVDWSDWENMAAHAQTEEGHTACESFEDAVVRVNDHGHWVREAVANRSPQQLAMAIGGALHTIQDNCSHSGMPNPQHAWFSVADYCDKDLHSSPDAHPDALDCAIQDTDAVFAELKAYLQASGYAISDLGRGLVGSRKKNASWMGWCDYMGSADEWDGVDRRWENSVARPLLRRIFLESIRNTPVNIRLECNPQDLAPISPEPTIDTSEGPDSCLKLGVVCLGKADDGTLDEEMPDDEGVFGNDEAPSAGCSVSAGGASGGAGLLLPLALVAGGALIRRRKR